MAYTPTSRRTGLVRRTFGGGAAVALAVAATLALAAPAGAHVPKVDAYCADEGTTLEVKLTNYNATHENYVTVIADDEVLVDEEVFETTFEQVWSDFDPAQSHVFEVAVLAWDDEDGDKGWSIVETLEVEACVTAPTPTTTEAPPTTTKPAPPKAPGGGDSGGLADTGASIAIPIVLGVLLVAGGGALMLVRRRGSSNA